VGANADELALMGEGDVRHFCRKVNKPSGEKFVLPDPPNGKGSPYTESPHVTQFAKPLDQITRSLAKLEEKRGHEIAAYKIMVCRSVHSKVRSQLETLNAFDITELHQHLVALTMLLEQSASASALWTRNLGVKKADFSKGEFNL
jgi:hypothetical protein